MHDVSSSVCVSAVAQELNVSANAVRMAILVTAGLATTHTNMHARVLKQSILWQISGKLAMGT